jgi:hypothetical protein
MPNQRKKLSVLTLKSKKQESLTAVANDLIQQNSRYYTNIGQKIILTTEDKIWLCLHEHLSKIEKRKGWISPLSILLAIITVFFTTDFKSFLSIKAETWEALFLLGLILSAVWLLYAIIQAIRSPTIQNIVDEIKLNSEEADLDEQVKRELVRVITFGEESKKK